MREKKILLNILFLVIVSLVGIAGCSKREKPLSICANSDNQVYESKETEESKENEESIENKESIENEESIENKDSKESQENSMIEIQHDTVKIMNTQNQNIENQNNENQNSDTTESFLDDEAIFSSNSLSDAIEIFHVVTSLKQIDYEKLSVEKFNNKLKEAILQCDNLIDGYSSLLNEITSEDENYTFVTSTLATSLEEILGKQMNENPIMTFNVIYKDGTEQGIKSEELNDFYFIMTYGLEYKIKDESKFTIGKRDEILKTIKSKIQVLIDEKTVVELESENTKENLSVEIKKVIKECNFKGIKIWCKIQNIEIYNE